MNALDASATAEGNSLGATWVADQLAAAQQARDQPAAAQGTGGDGAAAAAAVAATLSADIPYGTITLVDLTAWRTFLTSGVTAGLPPMPPNSFQGVMLDDVNEEVRDSWRQDLPQLSRLGGVNTVNSCVTFMVCALCCYASVPGRCVLMDPIS